MGARTDCSHGLAGYSRTLAGAISRSTRGLGPGILRAFVTMAAICLALGYTLVDKLPALEDAPISWRYLSGHVVAMSVFGCLSYPLFHHSHATLFQLNLLAAGWLIAGFAAIPLSIFILIPPRFCRELARLSGPILLLAIPAVLIALYLGHLGQLLWRPSAGLTFRVVHVLLDTVIHGVVADPVKLVIGTAAFRISISSSCSGLEGAGLMLVFTVAWIFYTRREYRHPQILVLIPASIVLMWLLNALRIAALIMIGNAGAPAVALGGFHSQAGWIAFNASALGFVFAASRIQWLKVAGHEAVPAPSFDNRAAAYLVPFLVILASAMLSRSASAGFEWLYPLRFLAAGAALWCYRDEYRLLDWRISWFAPLVGIAVFLLWIGLDSLAGSGSESSIPTALSAMPPWARTVWLAGRIGAAVITVPIAEELAFRGFLLRRFVLCRFRHSRSAYRQLGVRLDLVTNVRCLTWKSVGRWSGRGLLICCCLFSPRAYRRCGAGPRRDQRVARRMGNFQRSMGDVVKSVIQNTSRPCNPLSK